jgi:hypothetical protein
MTFFAKYSAFFRKKPPQAEEAAPAPTVEDLRPQAQAVLARCTTSSARVIHHFDKTGVWQLSPQQTVLVLALLKAFFIGLAFKRLAIPSKNPVDQAHASGLHDHLQNIYHEELAATATVLAEPAAIPDLIEDLSQSTTPAPLMATALIQRTDASSGAENVIVAFLEKEGIRFLAQV